MYSSGTMLSTNICETADNQPFQRNTKGVSQADKAITSAADNCGGAVQCALHRSGSE